MFLAMRRNAEAFVRSPSASIQVDFAVLCDLVGDAMRTSGSSGMTFAWTDVQEESCPSAELECDMTASVGGFC